MQTRFRVHLAPVVRAPALVLVSALAATLTGCAKNPLEQLSDDAARKQVIDAVLANPAARQ